MQRLKEIETVRADLRMTALVEVSITLPAIKLRTVRVINNIENRQSIVE